MICPYPIFIGRVSWRNTQQTARNGGDHGRPGRHDDDRRAIVMVRGVLKHWCSKRNAASGVRRWYCVALALLLAGVGLFGTHYPLYGIASIVVAYLVARMAPKSEAPSRFETACRYDPVPDELLELLADAATLPIGLKAKIADFLREEGQIMYDDLFALETRYLDRQARGMSVQGQGYRKMMAFVEHSSEQNHSWCHDD